MNNFRIVSPPRPTLRGMGWGDLPQILQIARQRHMTCATDDSFLTALRSNETVGCVAECHGRIAGFVICAVVVRHDAAGASPIRRLTQFVRQVVLHHLPQSLHLSLLGVAVAPQHGMNGKRLDQTRHGRQSPRG